MAWPSCLPVTLLLLLLLLLLWHAPLGVRSARHRHQSPEWTILSHSYRLIHGEIVRPQVLLDVFIHVVRERPGGLLQFFEGEAVMILLAFVSRLAFSQCGRTEKDAVLGQ